MVDCVAQALADLTIGDSASNGTLIEVFVKASPRNNDCAQKLSWAEQVGAGAVEERVGTVAVKKRLTLTLLKLLLSLLK
jgi:hypothetical protein